MPELGLTVLAFLWLVQLWDGGGLGLLTTWNVLAVVYIAAGAFLLGRDLPGADTEPIGELVGPPPK